MKPFDLEKALAGAPVIRRNGTKVKKIYVLDCVEALSKQLLSVDEKDGMWTHTKNGEITESGDWSEEFELFMGEEEVLKTVKKTYYQNVFLHVDGMPFLFNELYATKEEAFSAGKKYASRGASKYFGITKKEIEIFE